MNGYSNRPTFPRPLIFATIFAALVLAVVALSAHTAHVKAAPAPAFTGGVISSDTTWTSAMTITSPITVTSGTTLTIAPGVEVHFYPDTWLHVEGRLNAQGTHARQVRMIAAPGSQGTSPAAASWQGLIAVQPSADIHLQSATIASATIGLAIRQGGAPPTTPTRIEILDSRFESNSVGIAADYSGIADLPPLTLRNNLLTHNGVGMQVLEIPKKSNQLKLNHNSFVGNGIGLKVTGPGSLRAQEQWWDSAAGPLVGAPVTCAPPMGLRAGDLVCGPVDFTPWSKVPTGRMILAARAAGVIESALGPEALSGDDTAPTSIMTLTVPAGTFTQTVDLLLSGRAPSELPPGLPGYPTQLALEATAVAGGREIHHFAIAQPLQLEIHYTESDLNGADPSKLVLYSYDESLGAWSAEGISTTPDPANRRMVARLAHLSRFRVTSLNLNNTWLPVVVR